MNQPSHVHTPDDGRGPRRVYLNGTPIYRVIYADTLNGEVRFHSAPPQLDSPGEDFVEHTLYGVVTVEPLAAL